MGRPKKYKTEEERKKASREAHARWRAKQKGEAPQKTKREPKSWVRRLERKLEAVAQDESSEAPSTRSGEPFADLPPLPSMPASDAPTDGAGSTGSAEDASATSSDGSATPSQEVSGASSSGKTNSPKGEGEIFDTQQLEAMATQIAHDGVMMMGAYASERGYFALGEPFAKLAGVAAGVLVRVHAKNVGISDEEAAAWVLGGIVGTNGVQCFRAWREEQEKKSASEKARFDERRRQAEEARRAQGLPKEPEREAAPVIAEDNRPKYSAGVV